MKGKKMYKFNRIIYYSLTLIALLIILPITISRLFISIQCSIYDSDIYGMRYYLFFNFYTIILSVFILFIMNKLHKNNKIISSRTLGIFLLVYPILIGLIVIFAFLWFDRCRIYFVAVYPSIFGI